jgi:hypothetical protein
MTCPRPSLDSVPVLNVVLDTLPFAKQKFGSFSSVIAAYDNIFIENAPLL